MTPPLWVEIGFGIAGLLLLAALFWFSHSYGIIGMLFLCTVIAGARVLASLLKYL